VVLFLLLFFSAAFVATYHDSGQTRSRTTYSTHLVININGDSQLQTVAASESWPGDGTSTNPYIIRDYDINGQGNAYAISIQGTTLYLNIQDCYVHGATTAGIRLLNVIHAKLLRDVCSASQYGIYLDTSVGNSIVGCDGSGNSISGVFLSYSGYTRAENNTLSSTGGSGIYSQFSENLTIANNTCSWDTSYGIYLFSAFNSMISGNTCTNNNNGIYLLSSSGNALIGNTCTGGSYGIWMRLADSNTLIGNNCSSSSTAGLYARACTGNTIQNSSFWSNSGPGVWLELGASSNLITNNTFAYNSGSSGEYDPSYKQAFDGVGSNSWNSGGSPHGFGNYWYDWTSPDGNSDGIVDNPYVLEGIPAAQDNFPLVSTPVNPIPEFGPLGLLLTVFSSIAAVLLLSRRMKT
jgi:parallel beta-helix repeat protein